MKNTVVLLAGGLAAMVTAQDLTDCSRRCLNNMLGLASELGCAANLQGDQLLDCLCRKTDYAYGINDCTLESCSREESLQAVEAARTDCQRVGVVWSATVGGGSSQTIPEVSGIGTGTSGGADVTNTPNTKTDAGVPTVIVSGSQTITTILNGETGTSGSATAKPTESGDQTTARTASESQASETSGGADPSATGSGDGSAAIRSAAPAVGVLIAAGIAALLL